MSSGFSRAASCHSGFACYTTFSQRRTIVTMNALRGALKRMKQGTMFVTTRKSGDLKSSLCFRPSRWPRGFNPPKPELNPICYLLALLGAHHFLHVGRIRVKLLTFMLLMSYIYGAPILDVSRSHTTTQHSR